MASAAAVQRNTDHPPEMAAQCDMGPGPNRMLVRQFPASYNDQIIVYKESFSFRPVPIVPERFNLRNYRQSDNSYKFMADAVYTPFPTLRFCWPRGGTEFGRLMEQALQGGSVNVRVAAATAAAAAAAATAPIFNAQVTTDERFHDLDELKRNTDHFNHEANYCHPEPGPSRRLIFRSPAAYDGRVFIYNIKSAALSRQEVFDIRNILKGRNRDSYYKFEGDTTYTHEEDVRFCWVRGGMTPAEGRTFEDSIRPDIVAGRRPSFPATARVVPVPIAPVPTILAAMAPLDRYYLCMDPSTGRKSSGMLLLEKDRLFFISDDRRIPVLELRGDEPLQAIPDDFEIGGGWVRNTVSSVREKVWRHLGQEPRTGENQHTFLRRLDPICAARPGPLPDEVFANLDRFNRQLWVYTVDPRWGEIFKIEKIEPAKVFPGMSVWSYLFDGDVDYITGRQLSTSQTDLRFCYLQNADALDLPDCPICYEKVGILRCITNCGNRHTEVFHFKCLQGLPIKPHGRRECPLDNAPFDGIIVNYYYPIASAGGGAASTTGGRRRSTRRHKRSNRKTKTATRK
jgi:hypothetical protein